LVWRYVNNDDKVEQSRLSSFFYTTSRAWQKRYGVPYTHCGCPIPDDTIGKQFSRLLDGLPKTPGYKSLVSPINPLRKNDSLSATHPSDHSAVYVKWFSNTHRTRRTESKKRRREWSARLTRMSDIRPTASRIPRLVGESTISNPRVYRSVLFSYPCAVLGEPGWLY